MTLLEALRKVREFYLSGEYSLAISEREDGAAVMVVDVPGLVFEAAGGNGALAESVLEALDAVTPGGLPFGLWVDGCDGPTYAYGRKPAAISALIGKACVRAQVNKPAEVAP